MNTTIRAPRRRRESYWRKRGMLVAGVDEVGRGAWAGPLVAAAVICPPRIRLTGVRDSKLLTPTQRRMAARRVAEQAVTTGVGIVQTAELNQYGLAWAIATAGQRAVAGLSVSPTKILLDGRHNYFGGTLDCEAIIRGDSQELCIAAASIVAKVRRDELMVELDHAHPAYGFARHKGYGTPDHQAALWQHGPSPVHRLDYAPIQSLLA